jgi:hypothetical protein
MQCKWTQDERYENPVHAIHSLFLHNHMVKYCVGLLRVLKLVTGSTSSASRWPYNLSSLQTNSVALSPRTNYTDWATATCRRNLVPTFVDRGVSRGQRGGSPTVVNLSFLERSRYFSFKYLLIYPHKGWVDPFPEPTVTQKIGQGRESICPPLPFFFWKIFIKEASVNTRGGTR